MQNKKILVNRTYDDIGRIYNFSDGSSYYSVTTMLGHTKDKKFLEEWRERVGILRAEEITRQAGFVGTDVHDCCEKYLLKQEIKFPNAVIKNLFNQIKPYIDKRVQKTYFTEQFLWSDELKLAGSCDAIVDYITNDGPFYTVLDFKTSKRLPKIEWINDYFLQLSAYALMINNIYNKMPKKGALLFAYKEQRSPYNEIVINTNRYIDPLKKRVEMFQKMIK